MKILAAAAVVLLLAGCATPQVNQEAKTDKYTQPAKRVQTPVKSVKEVKSIKVIDQIATTPNEVVKKRWYDRFLRHKTAK